MSPLTYLIAAVLLVLFVLAIWHYDHKPKSSFSSTLGIYNGVNKINVLSIGAPNDPLVGTYDYTGKLYYQSQDRAFIIVFPDQACLTASPPRNGWIYSTGIKAPEGFVANVQANFDIKCCDASFPNCTTCSQLRTYQLSA
jgi:hypothetical protein